MILGSLKDTVSELSKRVMQYYEELVKTTAKFDDLRLYTRESLEEYKKIIQKQQDRMSDLEKERVKAEAELLTKIDGLEARLNALSEKALHSVAMEAARSIMDEKIQISHDALNGNPGRLEDNPKND